MKLKDFITGSKFTVPGCGETVFKLETKKRVDNISTYKHSYECVISDPDGNTETINGDLEVNPYIELIEKHKKKSVEVEQLEVKYAKDLLPGDVVKLRQSSSIEWYVLSVETSKDMFTYGECKNVHVRAVNGRTIKLGAYMPVYLQPCSRMPPPHLTVEERKPARTLLGFYWWEIFWVVAIVAALAVIVFIVLNHK